MLMRVLAIIAVAVMLASTASADELLDGFAAYQRGDYATALRLLRPIADQGDAMAQSVVGILYSKGEGVPQNDGEATRWYRKAAEQGNAMAQFELGELYQEGQGIPQDYAEAAKWYRKGLPSGTGKPPSRATPAASSTSAFC